MSRLLGLDFGVRRVGAALSDPRRLIATPLEVYARVSAERDILHYRAIAVEHEAVALVVGLPLHTGGGEGDAARLARDWGRWLASGLNIGIFFYDERYTTVDADEILRDRKLNGPQRRARRDMLAAQILLQRYLDAGCPRVEAPALGLDDAYP